MRDDQSAGGRHATLCKRQQVYFRQLLPKIFSPLGRRAGSGSIAVSSLFVIAEVTLFIRKKLAARSMDLEGCPPLPEVIARGRLTGMSSYKITANPDYKHLFDADGTDEVSEALSR